MRVSDTMSRDVRWPDQRTPSRARPKSMVTHDAGVLPVGDGERLVGMITDRDIAVRAVAAGKGPETPVREVMSRDVKYCFEDQELEVVARNMGEVQLRRLPVVDRAKRLVGIVSIGDVAAVCPGKAAARALMGVTRPGRPAQPDALRRWRRSTSFYRTAPPGAVACRKPQAASRKPQAGRFGLLRRFSRGHRAVLHALCPSCCEQLAGPIVGSRAVFIIKCGAGTFFVTFGCPLIINMWPAHISDLAAAFAPAGLWCGACAKHVRKRSCPMSEGKTTHRSHNHPPVGRGARRSSRAREGHGERA